MGCEARGDVWINGSLQPGVLHDPDEGLGPSGVGRRAGADAARQARRNVCLPIVYTQ